jgi:hypothetical protein
VVFGKIRFYVRTERIFLVLFLRRVLYGGLSYGSESPDTTGALICPRDRMHQGPHRQSPEKQCSPAFPGIEAGDPRQSLGSPPRKGFFTLSLPSHRIFVVGYNPDNDTVYALFRTRRLFHQT